MSKSTYPLKLPMSVKRRPRDWQRQMACRGISSSRPLSPKGGRHGDSPRFLERRAGGARPEVSEDPAVRVTYSAILRGLA